MTQFAAIVATDKHAFSEPFRSAAVECFRGHEDQQERVVKCARALIPTAYKNSEIVCVPYLKLSELVDGDSSAEQTIKILIIPCSRYVATPVVLERPYGSVSYLPSPESPRVDLVGHTQIPKPDPSRVWPQPGEDEQIFMRIPRAVNLQVDTDDGVFVSRWDDSIDPLILKNAKTIWVAGPTTWRKLIEKNVFVTGSVDNLGMQELENIPVPMMPKRWVLVSHSEAPYREGFTTVPLYSLVPTSKKFFIEGRTHFYWQSSSLFEHVYSRHPEIADKWHGCGPGATYDALLQHIPESRIKIFLSKEYWNHWIHDETETATKAAVHEAHT